MFINLACNLNVNYWFAVEIKFGGLCLLKLIDWNNFNNFQIILIYFKLFVAKNTREWSLKWKKKELFSKFELLIYFIIIIKLFLKQLIIMDSEIIQVDY